MSVELRELTERRDHWMRRAVRADFVLAATERDTAELHQRLMPLCPCPTAAEDERAQEPGPRADCPIHGDGVTFVAYVQRLERLMAVAAAARHWLAMRPNAHDSWSESTRKLAAAAAALDGA